MTLTVQELVDFLQKKDKHLPVYFDGSTKLMSVERVATIDGLTPVPESGETEYVMLSGA